MAPALVQHTFASFSGVTSASVTYGSPVTIGNRSVTAGSFGGGNATGVVDNATAPNSYNNDNPEFDAQSIGVNTRSAQLASNPSSGNLKVTWSFNALSSGDLYAEEVSALGTAANIVDVTGTVSQITASTSAAINTSSASTAANEYCFAVLSFVGTVSGFAGASGTIEDDDGGPNTDCDGHKLSVGGVIEHCDFTWTGSSGYVGQITVYQLAPAGGPLPQRGPGPRYRLQLAGQLPLPSLPVATAQLFQPPTPQPVTRGPQFRYPLNVQGLLGGLPNPIAASDTATGADNATVTQYPDVGYRPPQPGPLFRFPQQGQVPLGEDSTQPIPISAVDTGLGTDAVTQIGLNAADIGTGSDSASVVAFDQGFAQQGNRGPRFQNWIQAQQPLGGVLVVPFLVSASDTASGADAVALIALLSPADTGAGADAVGQINLAGADAGSGTDGVGSVGLNTTDAGTGADAVSQIALNAADASTSADGASALDLGVPTQPFIPQGTRGPRFQLVAVGMVPLGAPLAAGPGPIGPANTVSVLQGRDLAGIGGRDSASPTQGRSTVTPT